jgi:hypothetical protein
MIKPVYIYTLNCPKTSDIRYVGKTKFPIEKRLEFHTRDLRGHSYKVKWIKSLISEGLKPTIHCIEIVNELNWVEKEIFWIAKMKSDGHNLVNNSIGGEGPSGAVYSEESLKNIREGHVKRIIFCKENGISLNPLKNKTPEERSLIAFKSGQKMKGRKLSTEIRRKISNKLKGTKWSNERRSASSALFKNREMPEAAKKAFIEKCSKPITQLTREGLFVNEYPSLKSASEKTSINKGHIASCARGERKTAGNHVWFYN